MHILNDFGLFHLGGSGIQQPGLGKVGRADREERGFLFKIDLQRGNMLVPLVIQVVTALEILMPAVVFITSLRCRKYNDMNLNLDEGPVIHRSNWLTFFLLLIFDIVPVALPVISTFYLWRGLI